MANSKIPNITLADTLNTQRLRVNQLLDSVGDVSTLTTVAGSVVGAINEHDAELGDIEGYLMGTTAETVSGAIGELAGRLDSINDTQLSTRKIYVSDSNAANHIKGTVNVDTDLNVGGSVDIDTDLTVHGNLVIDGTTAISAGANGEINLGDGLQDSDTVIFNAEIGSDIVPGSDDQYDIGSSSKEFRHGYFDGTVNADELQSDSATIGTLKVTDLTNNRVVIVGAGDEIEDDANFTFDGNVLSVGNTSIDKDAVGINTTGLEADSATITGNLRVDGNVDLGDTSNDTVSITGAVDTDIVPSTDNERSLGSNSNQWKHLHVNGTGYIDEVSADSATLGTLKVSDLTSGRIVIGGTNGEITDDADLTYNTTSDTLAVSNIDIGTSAALASAKVEDLTDNRIVIAGTGGELEDNSNFTFDGDTFSVGSTTIDKGAVGINTTGLEADSANITADVSVGGDLQVTGGFTVGGAVTFTGETRYIASHQVLLDGVTVNNNNRAGLAVDRPSSDSAVIQWNELGDYWEAGVTTDLGRLALQGDSAQFLRVDGTTGSFDNVNVSVNLDVTGDLNVDGITTLDSTTVDGDLEVTGNFTVGGTTTYINTETVTIDDNIIVLNNNATGTPATDQDAGIEVERGSSTNIQLLWDESAKYWVAATDTNNTLSRIATANWLDATAPISYNSSTGNISHGTSGVSAGTYGSVTVDARGHVTGGTNPAFDNYASWTAKDSNGDTYTITSGDILTIKGDDDHVTTDWASDDVLKISHKNVTRSDTTSTDTPSYGGTFEAVTGVTTNAKGHVTAIDVSTVTIPASDNTDTIYSLPEATATVRGGIELFSNTDQSVAANAVTTAASRTYGIQLNSNGQAVVNVPWVDTNTDTNTTYSTSIPSSTTKLRLSGSDASTDDIEFVGSGATTVTRTNDSKFTISSTDTNTTYSAGKDLDLNGTTFDIESTLNYVNAITTATDTNFTLTTGGTGDIYLDPNGDTIFMRGGSSSDQQLSFQLGTSAQEIVASDELVIGATNGDLTLYTTTSGDVDLNPASGQIGLFDNGTERAGFDVNTANTLKIYTGSNFGTLNSTFSGNDLTVQGDVTSVSDVRTKENIETVTNGLDLVSQLRGVRYNKIGSEDRKVGVIAQEVEEVLPEVVHTDTEGMKSVDYGKMVGVLIEAIKDLKSEVDMLKLKIGE